MKKIIAGIFFALVVFAVPASASAATYYVSPSGNDTNTGTASAPFKTFAKSTSMLTAGDTLLIYGGTYNEPLKVSASGTASAPITIAPTLGALVSIDLLNKAANNISLTGSYISASGLELKNSSGYCANIQGSYNTLKNSTVHECYDMGIYTDGRYENIIGNTVYHATMVNAGGTMTGGWGSGIKVRIGGDHILIQGNKTYNNWGEGMAITRASNVTVRDNFAFDNYSENIYVDNSYNVVVDHNIATCSTDTTYYRNGNPPTSIGTGEEYYAGWGNQLNNIVVTNNLSAYCGHGFAYWGADSGTGGMRNVKVYNNVFYNTTASVISIAYQAGTINSEIADNIFYSPNHEPWVENTQGISLHNNFWVGNMPSTYSNARGTNDLFGDVKFAVTPVYNDPSTFKIAAGSPAIDHGATVADTVDYFGTPRPQGAAYDMGAHEYGSQTVSTPGPTGSTPTATAGPKPGDANLDGKVDETDYSIWLSHYGQSVTGGAVVGDFDGNGRVDGVDYSIWLKYYGT